MSTSRDRFTLSEPRNGEAIPLSTLGYVRGRHKRSLFTRLLAEFENSGLSQSELCLRLGIDKATLSRYLNSPRNLEAETVSDLFFAMSGGIVKYEIIYPLAKNRRSPSEGRLEKISAPPPVKLNDAKAPPAPMKRRVVSYEAEAA